MRKLLSMLLVMTMVISLSACASKSSDTSTGTKDTVSKSTSTDSAKESDAAATTDTADSDVSAELTFTWWGNQTRNERTQAALDLYTTNNPGITFDVQPAEWSDYWTKLATASAGKSLPDLVQMDYKYLEQYVANDLLVDLTPYVESGLLDVSNVDEGILSSGASGDGLYAICAGINAPALLYNKTLLDEAGITVKDNMTLTEFIDLSREIYEKIGIKTNIAYNNGENFIEYTMRSQGYVLFEADKLGVKDAADLEVFFDLYETGIEEGWHLNPSVFAEITIGSVEQEPLVYYSSPETQSWCAFAYSNQLTAMKAAAPEGVEIGISTWPAENPSAANYLKPSQFFSVSSDSKNPEEAVKVLNYLLNSVECNEVLLGERGVPASTEVAATISPLMDDISQQVITYINNVVTPNSSAINPASPDGTSEVLEAIDSLEAKVLYGEMTAADAAAQLLKQGNAILAK